MIEASVKAVARIWSVVLCLEDLFNILMFAIPTRNAIKAPLKTMDLVRIPV